MAEEAKTELGFGKQLDSALADIDFDWGDDGELHVRELPKVPEADGEQASEEAGEEKPANAAAEGEGDSAEPEAKEEPKEDPAIAELKAEIEALKAEKKKDQTPEEKAEQADELTIESMIPEDKDLVDIFSDREQGIKFLKDAVQSQLSPLIDALRPMVIQWRVTQEARNMFEKHGEEFQNRLPLIKELVQKRPDLTLEAAFDLVRSIPQAPKSEAKTDQVEAGAGPEKKADPTVNAADEARKLAEKAAALRTEHGVSGKTDQKTEAKTVKEALGMAIDAALYG
jgi:hypothetical protein